MLAKSNLRFPIGKSKATRVLIEYPLTHFLLWGIASYLARSVSCVPQGIPQVLPRPCGRVHNLHRQAWVSLSPGRVGVPVGLSELLPHHHVEAAARLIAKHKSSVVIVSFRVNEEGATEVHSIKLSKAWKMRSEPGYSWKPWGSSSCSQTLTAPTDRCIWWFLFLFLSHILNIGLVIQEFHTHLQQVQGHSWQSGQVLYPDGVQPN